MAYYEVEVDVLREEEVKRICSRQVVPGDIVFFKNPMKIPFDCILLEGSCLVNECSLTGESTPVSKKQEELNESGFKRNYLYDGTYLIQAEINKKIDKFEMYRTNHGLPSYVARTNFTRMKGQLIRTICYPDERRN